MTVSISIQYALVSIVMICSRTSDRSSERMPCELLRVVMAIPVGLPVWPPRLRGVGVFTLVSAPIQQLAQLAGLERFAQPLERGHDFGAPVFAIEPPCRAHQILRARGLSAG